MRRRAVSGAALGAAATLVPMWPYTGVITPGRWTFVVVVLVAVIALTGLAARSAAARLRRGTRELIALCAQLAAAGMIGTALLAPEGAGFGLIPTSATVRVHGIRIQQALDEIVNGSAPLAASVPLATLLGLSFAVVAVLVDHLVAQRLALLAVLLTTVVGAMPMLVTFGGVNIAWFLLHAVLVLLLLRTAARGDRDSPREASFAVAMTVGAASVAGALIVAPGLPAAETLPGAGAALTVDANLRLGDDLRRPRETEVLTVVTTGTAAPYLRMATLSRFDGEVWRPDRSRLQPLSDGFGGADWTEEIATTQERTSIRVLGMSSSRLPVPYAAEEVFGVASGWSAMPLNRTVISRGRDAAGSDYTVEATVVTPTLEQIQAAEATAAPVDLQPAADLPPVIAETAREVTAGAQNDYDRLIALQDWFRSAFSYSLEAPVEEGFDGTGVEAVERFLQERTGYCIHFAGAFALMAQTMDMPVRIVVGYLPGNPTDQQRGDDTVYSVTSDQLHAWPEVFFSGIGWVPFEPTATLGVPTAFAPASTTGGTGGTPDEPGQEQGPTTAPTTGPTAGQDPRADEAGGGDALRTVDPRPVTYTVLGVLAVVLLPAAVRAVRRLVRFGRARAGDALAAWRELTDTLVDLGLPATDAQTVRMRAAELVEERGVDAAAIARLVDALEQAGYARNPRDAGDLAAPLRTVLRRLGGVLGPVARIRALMMPRSLLPRIRSRSDGARV
ncbi:MULTISPECIES: transglutaminase TgpA family protein [Microbacterium]|uniref:transglutaminase TgpA family protein n=1 Tax=Microbacterium TaxID=33882 RepID=UPI00217E748B|nr:MULTISPECIES: DUF3488 and transglutaminase-like domain-containing protein [Microbacterium]UWF77122.1 transglutaminase domain-containing protein [Microbacterium neungamense]WCM55283.1 transglutaminase domain-containing protein [Microbacterium sp. EF45047]